jgi:cell division protein FtsB
MNTHTHTPCTFDAAVSAVEKLEAKAQMEVDRLHRRVLTLLEVQGSVTGGVPSWHASGLTEDVIALQVAKGQLAAIKEAVTTLLRVQARLS